MKRNPLVVCLLIICITILAFTLRPDKRSTNCGSGTVIRRLLRSWPARPGKGKRGDFPRASD